MQSFVKKNIWQIFIILLIAAVFIARFFIIPVRFFDADEFEHLHAAYSIHNSMVPYRDFFEHHTPFFHYILSFFYPIFGETFSLIIAARFFMLIFVLPIFILTFLLGKKMFNKDVGLMAALLLSYVIVFLRASLEIRPDTPAVMLLLLSIFFIREAFRKKNGRLCFLAGLFMGIAMLFTQKIIIPALGISAGFIYQIVLLKEDRRRYASMFLKYCAGYLIPLILAVIFFAFQRAAYDFIYYNFLINFCWKVKVSPSRLIKLMLFENPIFCFLGLWGVVLIFAELKKRSYIIDADHFPFAVTLVVVAGIFVIPVTRLQYYMLFLPLWAIYGANAIWRLVNFTYSEFKGMDSMNRFVWILGLPICATLLMLNLDRQGQIICACGLAVIFLISFLLQSYFNLRRHIFICVISLVIFACAFNHVCSQFKWSNKDQIADIRYIMETTSSSDTIQDGFQGLGVFRPHAYYYWFLHPEIQAMLDQKKLSDDLIAFMEKNKTKIVIYDDFLKALPEKFQQYIGSHFKPAAGEKRLVDIRIRIY